MKLSLLCLLLLAAPEVSPASTLLFSQLEVGPLIDINALHTQGALFGFAPGQAAYHGATGAGGTFVTLGFEAPGSILEFDTVLQSIFDIEGSDTGSNEGPPYSESHFPYSGRAIDGAVIRLLNGLDNLVFGAPESGTSTLMAAGLIGLGTLKRCRRS